MNGTRKPMVALISMLLCVALAGSATAQSNGPEAAQVAVAAAFTFQGQLERGGAPFTGTCDMDFKLWDAAAAGVQQGSTLNATGVNVSAGVFAIELNFGNHFTGQARWVEPAVQCADDASFTTLPRVALTAAPYAMGLMPGATVNGDIPYGAGDATFKATNASASDGTALFGHATAGSGATAGVFGLANSPAGAGVWGKNDNFVGVLGESTYNPGVAGTSSAGAGVSGFSATNFGVSGESLGHDGVHGLSHQPGFSGVAGINDAVGGIGVYGNAPNGLAARFDNQTIIQSPGGTVPLFVRQDAAESGTPGLAVFQTSNGTIGSLGAAIGGSNTGVFVVGAASGKALGLNVNGTTRAMTIGTNGYVGIGSDFTQPFDGIGAPLVVRGTTSWTFVESMRVEESNGFSQFSVFDNGTVGFGALAAPTTNSLCWRIADINAIEELFFPASCSSAAEYVPTIDGGAGFPETADLVSIAPAVANPYGDTHAPFAVQKAAMPCDPDLFGFIVNPESGASGEKLNDHYLPLAIYGYFPAKVTTENGLIHRGDALTSSSTPGRAMKANQACKIIGYALEDADHDSTIQVFAHQGESAVSEVVTLRTQVQELSQAVADLRQANAALDQRLTALEQTMSGQAPVQSAIPREAVLMGALLVFGMVVGRRSGKGGSN